MITLVEELYYEDLHLIKVAGDTDHAFKIIIMRRIVCENGAYDWEPVDYIPSDEKTTLDRVKKYLRDLYSKAR